MCSLFLFIHKVTSSNIVNMASIQFDIIKVKQLLFLKIKKKSNRKIAGQKPWHQSQSGYPKPVPLVFGYRLVAIISFNVCRSVSSRLTRI